MELRRLPAIRLPPRDRRQALALFTRFNYVPAPHTSTGHRQAPAGYLPEPPGGREDSRDHVLRSAASRRSGAAAPLDIGPEKRRTSSSGCSPRPSPAEISDVPLGAFLSGGVDSSTWSRSCRSSRPRPVKSFSIGFHDGPITRRACRRRRRHLGTDHTELYVSRRCDGGDPVASVHLRRAFRDAPVADPFSSRGWPGSRLRWRCRATAATNWARATTAIAGRAQLGADFEMPRRFAGPSREGWSRSRTSSEQVRGRSPRSCPLRFDCRSRRKGHKAAGLASSSADERTGAGVELAGPGEIFIAAPSRRPGAGLSCRLDGLGTCERMMALGHAHLPAGRHMAKVDRAADERVA